jgi:competence protein ComGF
MNGDSYSGRNINTNINIDISTMSYEDLKMLEKITEVNLRIAESQVDTIARFYLSIWQERIRIENEEREK